MDLLERDRRRRHKLHDLLIDHDATDPDVLVRKIEALYHAATADHPRGAVSPARERRWVLVVCANCGAADSSDRECAACGSTDPVRTIEVMEARPATDSGVV